MAVSPMAGVAGGGEHFDHPRERCPHLGEGREHRVVLSRHERVRLAGAETVTLPTLSLHPY